MPRTPNVPCSQCGKLCWPTSRGRAGFAQVCRGCLPKRGRTHGRSATYAAGCRCDECRLAHARRQNEYQRGRRKATGEWPNTGYRRRHQNRPLCAGGCGKLLRTGSTACRACTPLVARRMTRRRAAQKKLDAALAGASSRWVWTSGPCAWCEERFVARGSGPARYCSARCKRKAAKPSGGFKVKPSVRAAIYERDEWTCQLCLSPVDPDLPPLDNWAASLDHIECQAWALVPDHSPENLRLAHRWCNSKRADETYTTAAELVA